MANFLQINQHLSIPVAELEFRFSRSGGRGGQNVNKVETRVELLFDVLNSPSLSDKHREMILAGLGPRIDTSGVLRVVAQESRSQWQNREHAVRRFTALLQRALKPRRKRIKTRTPTAAREQRMKEKKHRSTKKQMRRVRDE